MGQQGPLGAKKFSKMILDHMECQNKCFWRILSPWWPRFGPPKIQKCLENGLFGTKNGSKMGQKWAKNGSKWVFPKMIPDHLGCLNN